MIPPSTSMSLLCALFALWLCSGVEAQGGASHGARPESLRVLLPAPPHEQILWATLLPDGRIAASTPSGPKVVQGDHWVSASSLRLTRPEAESFEVREDCHVVRRRDHRDFGMPEAYPSQGRERCTDRLRAQRVFADAADLPIAILGRGRVLRFASSRQTMVHVDQPNGARGYFNRGRGAGWQGVNPSMPRLLTVLPTMPPVFVGAEGDVARLVRGVDFDRWEAVVTVARPRPLASLRLASGALLLVRSDGLRIQRGGAVRDVGLDAASQAFLAETTRRIEGHGASRTLVIALGAERALLASERGLLFVDGNHAQLRQLEDGLGEIWGLISSDDHGGWIGLTHVGRVLRGRGAAYHARGSLTDVAGPDVPHPIGAFRGADGRVRLVDYQRALVCVSATGLEPCGAVVNLNLRAATPLDHGLWVDDQSIASHVLDQDGAHDVPGALPRLHHAFSAGDSNAPYSLADGVLARLEGGAWRPLAHLPEAVEPVSLDVTPDGLVVVGTAGGAMLGFD